MIVKFFFTPKLQFSDREMVIKYNLHSIRVKSEEIVTI